jgi:leucyl aminopeptidase
MNLSVIIFLVLCISWANADDMRLIQFNETYSVWMSQAEVDKLASECGANGQETNFMDITDYPDLGDHVNRKTVKIPALPTHQHVVHPLLGHLNIENLWNLITRLSAFPTRYYTTASGVEAANYLVSQYNSYGNSRPDVQVTTFPHSWAQPSVIARIIGSEKPDEIVIIGGHIDSTSSGSVAPGADDDASGSCTVLEVFRVLAGQGFVPERTLEFHGYAAEEVGLRGSQAIANDYAAKGKDVVAMLQLDMTGYVRSGFPRTIGIVTDFTNPTLTIFLRALVDEYIPTSWTNTQCGYACSDHASWFRAGYADAFAFESVFSNSNPYIHSSSDTLSRLSKEHALEFARLALSFSVELSYKEP